MYTYIEVMKGLTTRYKVVVLEMVMIVVGDERGGIGGDGDVGVLVNRRTVGDNRCGGNDGGFDGE